MKHLRSIILTLLIIVLIAGLKGVKAASLDTRINRSYIDNVWSFHYRNGKVFSYGQLPLNYANDKLAYCIQPETRINFDTYNSYDDWRISGYSEFDKKRMELYAYYGYGFKDHTSIKYYMATQELIWRLSKDEDIVWHVGDNSSTEVIDVLNEKNEILRLVDLSGRMPSMTNSNNILYTQDSYTFTDSNGVLELYDVSSNLKFNKEGNSITFKLDRLGSYDVYLKPIQNGYDKTVVYDREDSPTQDLATFKTPDLPSGKFTINVTKVNVKINKKDKDTNELIRDTGNKVIIDGKEYTFKDGVINLRLGAGTYTIKEVNASDGYYINDKELKFTIENDSKDKEIDFYNEKIKGVVKVKKTNEDGELLKDIKFEIYDENNKKVDEIFTTENEYDSSKVLPLGKYYLKEVKTLNGYELDNKVYNVSLDYINNKDSLVMKQIDIINNKKICEVTFISSDDLGNKVNTEYEVYDKNMNILFRGSTKEGKAVLPLNYGKYFIKEVSIENGYILNDEIKEFEVSDDFCLASITINNIKTIMPKTTTTYDVWILLVVILDIIGIIYVKKNS